MWLVSSTISIATLTCFPFPNYKKSTYKGRKPREANGAYVKDYLKCTQDLAKESKCCFGTQDDHNFGQKIARRANAQKQIKGKEKKQAVKGNRSTLKEVKKYIDYYYYYYLYLY